jgi:hypothetical protein
MTIGRTITSGNDVANDESNVGDDSLPDGNR